MWDDALREEINRTSDAFEAFGLKIPAQATTLWGAVLILGVQLYLLTHLIELTRKIDAADPGWEVAWIGIYQRGLARVLFFCSAILLPPITVFVVGYKAVTLSTNITRSVEIQAWLLMIVGGLISIIVAAITARCLPQKSIPAADEIAPPASELDAKNG